MELFAFCLNIIKREATRFTAGFDASIAPLMTAATSADANYDIVSNRCAFIYRYGTINLCFVKDCFNKFLTDYSCIALLLTKWTNSPDLTLCSLSQGPAFDYIALSLCFQNCSMFKNIKVITKHGAWRNTVNIMHEIIREGYIKSLPPFSLTQNIKVIQGDLFEKFTEKVKNSISNSDVVMMRKMLNLKTDVMQHTDKEKIFKSLQEFFGALKTDTVLFCIDTKPSITVFTQILTMFPGKFLFVPTHMNTTINLNLEDVDFYKNVFGCLPVMSARGSFFVWQKSAIAEVRNSSVVGCQAKVSELELKVNVPVNDSFNKVVSDECKRELANGNISINFAKRQHVTNTMQSTNNDRRSVDYIISAQNSKCLSSPNSMCNSSINKCTQTEQDETLKQVMSSKIAQLTDRIANLTTELSDLLQRRASSRCTNNDCSKNSEDACTDAFFINCNDHEHSSATSCAHKCLCSNVPPCIQSCYRKCKYHHNYACQENHPSCSQYSSNASLNAHEATGCCSPNIGSKFCVEKNSSSIPQLVIPLSNLTADFTSEIISLLK